MDEQRHRRMLDRKRCHRYDNPLPRPAGDELLAMFGSRNSAQIADNLGHNKNTVRSWIERAR